MWIFIWCLVTIFVVGVSLWSFIILRQQKKSWEKFSKKHKFSYTAGRLMDSPYMNGRIDGLPVNFYTDTQTSVEARSSRYVSVVEVEMGEGLPIVAALATEKMHGFVNGLTLTKNVEFEHEGWNESYIARTDNAKKLQKYFTKKRLDTLVKLFTMKGATILFFCDEVDAVLRIETSDPLRDPEKMERIVMRLVRDMKVLMPTDEERAAVPKRKVEDDNTVENVTVAPVDAVDPASQAETVDAPLTAETEAEAESVHEAVLKPKKGEAKKKKKELPSSKLPPKPTKTSKSKK